MSFFFFENSESGVLCVYLYFKKKNNKKINGTIGVINSIELYPVSVDGPFSFWFVSKNWWV